MHPSILINWGKNNKKKPKSGHVLKSPFFWSFRAMHMYAYICIFFLLLLHLTIYGWKKNENVRGWRPCFLPSTWSCTWRVEGSDHIYQVHSQFCSGFSSIPLSPPSLVFENTHLQPASNHAPCFSNLLTPSDLQLHVWWVAKELWLPCNLTLYNIY